jgi:hypothetical protein
MEVKLLTFLIIILKEKWLARLCFGFFTAGKELLLPVGYNQGRLQSHFGHGSEKNVFLPGTDPWLSSLYPVLSLITLHTVLSAT